MQLSPSVAEPSCGDTMEPPSPEEFQQVLSLEQIRSIRATNNYVERPQQSRPDPSVSQPPHKHECPQRLLASPPFQDLQHQTVSPPPPHLSHSSTASSVSQSTAGSEHSGHSLVRTQPRQGHARAGGCAGKGAAVSHGHVLMCEACGRCRCPRCTGARGLPSCWLCQQRCLCSAESLLDYGTCLCCVKGIFYHCSSDDEDTCADEPCSCGPGSCCARWAAMSVLSLLLPCLCCYLPTLGCLKLCQRGCDGLKRPGCRCQSHTNTVCRKISSAGGTPFPKALDKPV